jgi:hypothetical protein
MTAFSLAPAMIGSPRYKAIRIAKGPRIGPGFITSSESGEVQIGAAGMRLGGEDSWQDCSWPAQPAMQQKPLRSLFILYFTFSISGPHDLYRHLAKPKSSYSNNRKPRLAFDEIKAGL